MSSSWTRTALKYGLLLAPAALLVGLLVVVAIGSWVTAVLRVPARFPDAPVLIQKLTRAAYWHTRRHWHTIPECVAFDPELLYRPRPGRCTFENAEFRTIMHFDDGGARMTPDPAPAPPGSPSKPRLVILGDSHAMGWGVEDRDTFASLLASEYGYRTLNLAVSSYATPRELLRLRRDFVLMPGDIVVLQYCDNDADEARQFAQLSRGRDYRPEELQRLFDYRPAPVSPLPVAGVLLRIVWKDLRAALMPDAAAAGAGSDPTMALLRVIEAYPELRGHRLLIVAINGPGRGTHLDGTRLAQRGLPLIVPKLTAADFFMIDDHMRPLGHRTVAESIDRSLRQR